MEYATNIADPGFHHEGEDLFKLATLCEEIAVALQDGAKASEAVEDKFKSAVKTLFNVSGAFRTEVEHHALAKLLMHSI